MLSITAPVLPRTPSPVIKVQRQRTASRLVPGVLAAVMFLLYAVYALREHARFGTTGYDLGIFDQAVRSYAEGRWPSSEIRTATAPPGFGGDAYPLLSDHFHPILALLAPLYLLAPHVETLLIGQAALVAGSTYVITRAAQRHLRQRWAALSLGLAYGLSWGLQQLIAFDFHEVAFALPLLALAGRAYLDGRWVAAAWWAAALLLVKEDLGVTAAVFGLLILRHHRRAGIVLAGSALAANALIVLVVLPALAPNGRYGYFAQQYPYGMLDGWPTKLLTLAALLAIMAGAALRSPLALLLLPTLAWRLVSPNPAYWGMELHYSAVLMPIGFVALIDVLRRGVRLPVFAPLLIAALLLPAQPVRDVVKPGFWRDTPRQAASRTAVELVPSGARVAASNSLAPHLTDRATVYVVADGVLARPGGVDWIVADVQDLFPAGGVVAVLGQAEENGWRTVYEQQGVVVLRRPSVS
ncbi:DUF2079 domain-containing protein [Streptomyces exfoliatus]|uniref:DUF2079 domain-containing protein n=1 Tax=Streptomyces exfoliatus TaxID=1905 RepID=UPI0012FF3475|nr:DUF2079 domain-containing protein [Streptomyces exfoliatus]